MSTTFKPLHCAWLREDGNAAVEFALIGALLIMFTVGTLELGRFAFAYHRLETAVGATTRLVQRQQPDDVIQNRIMAEFNADEQVNVQVDNVNIEGVAYRRVNAQLALPPVVPNFNLLPDNLFTVQVSQLVPVN
jgi:Flp pilus assembly protein TadG